MLPLIICNFHVISLSQQSVFSLLCNLYRNVMVRYYHIPPMTQWIQRKLNSSTKKKFKCCFPNPRWQNGRVRNKDLPWPRVSGTTHYDCPNPDIASVEFLPFFKIPRIMCNSEKETTEGSFRCQWLHFRGNYRPWSQVYTSRCHFPPRKFLLFIFSKHRFKTINSARYWCPSSSQPNVFV